MIVLPVLPIPFYIVFLTNPNSYVKIFDFKHFLSGFFFLSSEVHEIEVKSWMIYGSLTGEKIVKKKRNCCSIKMRVLNS